jgi:zinc transport system substrate-binding protein
MWAWNTSRALIVAAALSVAPAAALADLKVVVTIKPLHALVANIMAGTGVPDLLVDGASSAHTYALKPSDASKLNQADIFVRMSGTMEPFTVKLAKTLPKRVKLVSLEDAPGLNLLPRRTGATFEDDHGHAHKHGPKKHKHDHDHDHGAMDGHAWLDPTNAKLMTDRIVLALSAADKANAAKFQSNGEALKRRLDELSAEISQELAPVGKRPFVVFHDALQYFERRFGLAAVGSIAMSPEIAPSAQRLSTLRKKVVSLGAVCVLAEPQFDTRLVNNLTEGTKARIGTVDPEGAKLSSGPDLYFQLLRNIARDLKACLAAA